MGCPALLQGIFPTQGLNPGLNLYWQILYHLSHQGSPYMHICSVNQLCPTATPWTAARQASLSIINSWSLLKLKPIKSVMPSNHLILCHPLLLLPQSFPVRVFSNKSVLPIRWPKYWSFSLSISPSNEYSGLISFRMDWLDLLAVQGTLKSLLQHHSSKASILRRSGFFIVQFTSIPDHRKNHSLDWTDFRWQSNVSAFQYAF